VVADVEGVDEAKQDLEEIVEFLKSSKKYVDIGGRLSTGVLLHGPVCFFLIE
jgi:ATP-dependent Zn protease